MRVATAMVHTKGGQVEFTGSTVFFFPSIIACYAQLLQGSVRLVD